MVKIKLLTLVSLSNTAISYNIQCFSVLLIFYTDLGKHIVNERIFKNNNPGVLDFRNFGFILAAFHFGMLF